MARIQSHTVCLSHIQPSQATRCVCVCVGVSVSVSFALLLCVRPKIIGLFFKRALSKRRYSAKETYNFIDPTDRSHPIPHMTCRQNTLCGPKDSAIYHYHLAKLPPHALFLFLYRCSSFLRLSCAVSHFREGIAREIIVRNFV